ncbi:transmembrane protease serine 3-like [Sardina pilchardus]|uniref:transmembrane protease serine 3-like n=1 Tax=Sardina pilchardus TaxID=27697 RepID=UPI002E112811
MNIRKILPHARYRPRSLDHDIALLQLSQPISFNGLVEPVCLPSAGEEFQEDHLCWISGWGATEDGGETSVQLHSAQVPLMSNAECNEPQVHQGSVSPWMICAGYLEGGIDTCQGGPACGRWRG